MTTEQWREQALEEMWWGLTNGATKQPPPTALWLTKLIATSMTRELDRLQESIALPKYAMTAIEAYLKFLKGKLP